jgi:ribosomal protein S18
MAGRIFLTTTTAVGVLLLLVQLVAATAQEGSANDVLSSTLEGSQASGVSSVVTSNDLDDDVDDEDGDDDEDLSNLPIPTISQGDRQGAEYGSTAGRERNGPEDARRLEAGRQESDTDAARDGRQEDAAGKGEDEDKAGKKKKRKRRCKCLKRYLKEVQQLMDDRMAEFEARYQRHVTGDRERALAEVTVMTNRVQNMERVLHSLTRELSSSKDTLTRMGHDVEVLRYEWNHSRADVRYLNASVDALDIAVENLSAFVTRVERMIPQGLTRPQDGHGELAEELPQSYPRSEYTTSSCHSGRFCL